MADQFKADPDLKYESFRAHMLSTYGVEVSKSQMYRARKKANEQHEGSHAKSYGLIRKYAHLLLQANPGSMVKLQVDRVQLSNNLVFKRLFVCLDAMKKGSLFGCRPFIGIDGCHLKGSFGRVLLAAISLDVDNGIFPVAFAVVEIENKDNWIFFIQHLKAIIGEWGGDKPLVFMSDRQKGLPEAISCEFPEATQRYCCRDLYNNFKAIYPGLILRKLFWKAVKTYCPWVFSEAMNDIFKEAHGYLSKLSLEAWARHAFDYRVKSDYITNNMTESFNHWIGELRVKPILTLVESLVVKLMGKLHVRYENGCTLETNVAPKIKKKLNQIQNSARFCSLVPAGQMEFAVNLETKECQCRFWLISGLPCKHAVACMVYLRHDLESYYDDYYSKNAYQQTYNEIMHLVHDLKMVDMYETPGDIILPPVLRRLPGRPKKKELERWMRENLVMEKQGDQTQ